MNKDELLEQYEEELVSLDNEIKHHSIRNFKEGVDFCKGERSKVRQFIADLNNLTVEAVKLREGCLTYKNNKCTRLRSSENCKQCEDFK